jgi:MFS family permease
MQMVAQGWLVYDMTGSSFYLGLVGLARAIPALAFSLVGGAVADRYDRRAIMRYCQVVKVLMVALLAAGTAMEWLTREWMFAILLVASTARAFELPVMQALLPSIVPMTILPRAIAASATAQQTAIISGPAIGGLLYLLGPVTVYLTCAAVYAIAAVLVSYIELISDTRDRRPITLESVFAGFSYIWNRKILFGVMSLDLFVVLVGGITALLPIFAKDILNVGPFGLGWLQAASSIGSVSMALFLAYRPPFTRAGRTLLLAVAGFGLVTIVFGLSKSFALSFAMLLILGALDNISVVIRSTLLLVRTPDELRGRVGAVNSLFIGTSNQLGDFRAGVSAALFGAVPAVLIGGIGTLAVVAIWIKIFPALYRVERLEPQKD